MGDLVSMMRLLPIPFLHLAHAYHGSRWNSGQAACIKTRIGDPLVPSNIDPWSEVRDKLNRSLRGWSNYFGYGSRGKAYCRVDQYVIERERSFLA
jgi:RNA-directed DNA polymerase